MTLSSAGALNIAALTTAGPVITDASGNISSTATLAGTLGGTGISSTATFPSSGVVTTDAGSSTLTNKTIASGSNTITLNASTITAGTLATARGGTNASSAAATGLALVTAGAWTWAALSGDITSSGFVTTLATVNSNVGSFGSATAVATFTVNAKGLLTAAGSTSIQITESQVTNLVSDLAGKQASGNYITALTSDITASGPGSVAATLATVNANVGTFGSSTAIPTFTVNGKGLITAASTSVVIAPAGTLSGTTLNATVITSSLTAVGTIATGAWNATAISNVKGGTGGDSSGATGLAKVAAGIWSYATLLNADVNASAAIAYSKLAALTTARALVSDGSGFVSVSTTTTTQLQYLNAATGTTGTTSTSIVFSTSPTLTTPTLTTPTQGGIMAITSTTTGTIPSLTAGQMCSYRVQDIFVLAYNDAGTIRYKYLQMSGTGVTWGQTTTPV